MTDKKGYHNKIGVENKNATNAGIPKRDHAKEPVSIDKIEANRRRLAGSVVNQVVQPPRLKVEAKELKTLDLKDIILKNLVMHPRTIIIEKTWEDYKLCKDEEDGVWRDSAFESMARVICTNSCTVVLECLTNDLVLGGDPGIRAGMNQNERQLQYSANITPVEISEHIYEVRKQSKA